MKLIRHLGIHPLLLTELEGGQLYWKQRDGAFKRLLGDEGRGGYHVSQDLWGNINVPQTLDLTTGQRHHLQTPAVFIPQTFLWFKYYQTLG